MSSIAIRLPCGRWRCGPRRRWRRAISGQWGSRSRSIEPPRSPRRNSAERPPPTSGAGRNAARAKWSCPWSGCSTWWAFPGSSPRSPNGGGVASPTFPGPSQCCAPPFRRPVTSVPAIVRPDRRQRRVFTQALHEG
jgi:hypothetical protein